MHPHVVGRFTGVFLWAMLAAAAWAGEFYEPEGVAVRGFDVVAYFTDHKPVKGSSRYTVFFRGSLFQFASAEHRNAFLADPTRFAPQYGGFCAYGTARGYKAASDPEAFTVVDEKLYLNYSVAVRDRWREGLPEVIAAGDRNWPFVSKLTKVIP